MGNMINALLWVMQDLYHQPCCSNGPLQSSKLDRQKRKEVQDQDKASKRNDKHQREVPGSTKFLVASGSRTTRALVPDIDAVALKQHPVDDVDP